jgi:radical SAM enzyme (TIGR01210 family)
LDPRQVRKLRPPKEPVDPWRPLSAQWEEERTADGRRVPVLTLLLAGAECPFHCVFCDLWRHTLDGPTPAGAIPAQIETALVETGRERLAGARVKLYNASNYFEPRAVPEKDDAAVAELLAAAERVVVECHPRLVGERCLAFARRLGGRLEVAMGLETVHPRALPRLGKAMTLEAFDRAAATLRGAGIALRAFVLLGAPYVPPAEAVEWAVRSAEHAFAQGAEQVSLIPLRSGNGAVEQLLAAGTAVLPTLDQLEAALDACLPLADAHGAVATADLWDLDRLATCPHCLPARRARLARLNLTAAPEPSIRCAACEQPGRSGISP